jgi:hypothetical protein
MSTQKYKVTTPTSEVFFTDYSFTTAKSQMEKFISNYKSSYPNDKLTSYYRNTSNVNKTWIQI